MSDQKVSDQAAEVMNEVQAVRHLFNLPSDEREAAGAQLDTAACHLVLLVQHLARAMKNTPAMQLVDVAAILQRPALSEDLAKLNVAGALDLLDPAKGMDPNTCAAAFAKVLEHTAQTVNRRQAEEAAALLASVHSAATAEAGRTLLDNAAEHLERLQRQTEPPLAEAWDAHLATKSSPEAGPMEVLRLDERRRGPWAEWMNDHLGSRAGLEAGETIIAGGAPVAGKTSFAALLAVDALAAGCPVLFWQLELSREETLEHLLAQVPEPSNWWKMKFWERAKRPLPDTWEDLLTVPRWADSNVESIVAAMQSQARKVTRAERAGRTCHKVCGLVVVDYAQLLTTKDRGPRDAGHEVLTTAASRLAKAAAESGAVLLLLSQLNKQEQRDADATGTALAGADLARMAHRVVLVQKAQADGKACNGAADWSPDKGEARLLTWTKARGVRYTLEGRRPERSRVIWYAGQARAFHGGDAPMHDDLLA